MVDFAVVGGGPVGLLCALALRRLGRSVTLIERHASARSETRSIGVHAASLARLDQLGLLDQFLARGVRIERGLAFGSRGRLGEIDFRLASPAFGYALSIPQPQTEALLEHAGQAAGVHTLRGATVVGLAQRRDHVELEHARGGERRRLSARHLLACDGANSSVRALLGIAAPRQRLPGSYVMAEFPNTPALGHDACIFLTDHGLVESFPLPDDRRRWVVEAPTRRDHVDLTELCALVWQRTGQRLEPHAGAQASAFGLVQALADHFRCGRTLLLGDAAHVLSPFGGQGMNLGWLDAFALADLVDERWTDAGIDERLLEDWARSRRRAAKAALRQAAWNTRIGRRTQLPRARNALVRVALAGSLAKVWSRRFAMLSLDRPYTRAASSMKP
jgi:2-polyprenyl-6-methoxyphenol hydroxylase-like FAD-dependent oxidoreductase